jgi:DNA-binding transcriptional ArsR family regulator
MDSTTSLTALFDSELFQVFTEPIRLGILQFLALNGPTDIGSIAERFPQDRSVVSRHLQIMERAGIVVSQKVARRVIYSIDGAALVSKFEKNLELLKSLVPDCCGK